MCNWKCFCAAIVSLYNCGAMKCDFKLVSACTQHALISGQLHLLAAVPSAHCRWRITHRNRTGHSKPAFVRSNYTYTEQEQDIPAADHTHISDVLHSCAALCCQSLTSYQRSPHTKPCYVMQHSCAFRRPMNGCLQESGQRSCD